MVVLPMEMSVQATFSKDRHGHAGYPAISGTGKPLPIARLPSLN